MQQAGGGKDTKRANIEVEECLAVKVSLPLDVVQELEGD